MATRIGTETIARIEAAWPALIDAMESGADMTPIHKAHSVSRDQVRVYRLQNAERDREWCIAREQGADVYADQIAAIANDPVMPDSNAARVRIQALQWLASKRNPARYSDKHQLDVNVKTVDLTAVIMDANKRLAAAQVGRVIEGEVVRLALPETLDALF